MRLPAVILLLLAGCGDAAAPPAPNRAADAEGSASDAAGAGSSWDGAGDTAIAADPGSDRDGDHVDDAHDLAPDDPLRALPPSAEEGTARIIVAASPPGTPHLAGDFNGWTQTPMTAGPLGLFEATVQRPNDGSELRFKFTAGDWTREESGFRGPDANRTLGADAPPVLAAVIRAWGDDPPAADTTIGTVRVHEAFEAPELGRSATLRVLLPPGYDESSRHYPVLYMQDGQNLFSNSTAAFGTEWQADEAAWLGALEGRHPDLIIVGIDNSPARSCEYTPFSGAIGCESATPLGLAYASFVAERVKPFIDATYRTIADRHNTFTGGSSRGGLAALITALQYQETFGAVLGLSPTTLSAIVGTGFDAFVRAHARREPIRFFLDYGDAEVVYGHNAGELTAAMQSAATALRDGGFDSADIATEVIPGATHDEASWSRRLPARLAWLLRPPDR